MQVHEAKILRTAECVPRHMREEAERVLAIHRANVEAVGHPGRGFRPGMACSTEFATMQPADVTRVNEALVYRLALACGLLKTWSAA